MTKEKIIPYSQAAQEQAERSLSEQAKEGIKRPEHSKLYNDTMISTAGAEYDQAIFNIISELDSAIKGDATNDFYSSRYSTLAAVLTILKPHLKKEQMVINQFQGPLSSGPSHPIQTQPVFTRVKHVPTGQYEIFFMPVPPQAKQGGININSMASAITQAKRIMLMSYFCMATVDDDGYKSVHDILDTADAGEISEHYILSMKDCQTKQSLQALMSELSLEIRALNPKISKLIVDEYKLLMSQLPEQLAEDESQD